MPTVTKINVGAGKTKGIEWPERMTIRNRAQVPITITGQLMRAGTGAVSKQAAQQMPVFLPQIGGAGMNGKGTIKEL